MTSIQPVVDVVFFDDLPEAIMPDTIKLFLEVDEILKEFFLIFVGAG